MKNLKLWWEKQDWYWEEVTVLSVAILSLILFLVSLLVRFSTTSFPPEPSPDATSIQPPKFQRNHCFNRNRIREPWDTDRPDGIVAVVGVESYLLMYQSEAEHRGATKVAIPQTIRTFDAHHHRVECPESWKNHTHEGRRK